MDILPRSQSEHIKLNIGNVLAVGALSVFWVGSAMWIADYVAHVNIPVVSQLGVGMKYFLRTP